MNELVRLQHNDDYKTWKIMKFYIFNEPQNFIKDMQIFYTYQKKYFINHAVQDIWS
jgi:hypothetical protein